MELSRYLLPACLGDPIVTPKNDGKVQTIGWGQTGVGGKIPKKIIKNSGNIHTFFPNLPIYLESQATHLQAVNLSISATKKCNQDFEDDSNKPFRYLVINHTNNDNNHIIYFF